MTEETQYRLVGSGWNWTIQRKETKTVVRRRLPCLWQKYEKEVTFWETHSEHPDYGIAANLFFELTGIQAQVVSRRKR